MASQKSKIEEVINNIIGFAERIDTPFGEVCSLAADLTSNGRQYKPIEQTIEKIRTHVGQTHQIKSYDGVYSQNLHSFSKKAILDFFNTNDKVHQIEECGPHEISPYVWIGKILQANLENGKWEGNKKQEAPDIKVPVVYISSSENYYNVLGWKYFGCRVETAEANKESEINFETLSGKISKLSQLNIHFVSLSAVSSITGQKVPNIEKIIEGLVQLRIDLAQRNKTIRIFICLNITHLTYREKLDFTSSYLKNVDFFVLHSAKLIGAGYGSTNIIISKIESSHFLLVPQRPIQEKNNNLLDVIVENNVDSTKIYRIALSLELIGSLKVSDMLPLEKKNVEMFMADILEANNDLRKSNPLRSINVWGAAVSKTDFSFGNLSFNLYAPGSEVFDGENRAYLHPELVCSILHDIFGIIVVFKASVKLTDGSVLLNIPSNVTNSLNSISQPDSILGCVALDISFLHTEEEVKYIAKALRFICEKGEEFQKYYDRKTFVMNSFSYDNYDFNLNAMQKVKDTREEFVKGRQQRYESQLNLAKTVFKNHSRYFSLHDGYLKDKTEQLKKKDVPGSMPPVIPKKPQKQEEELNEETVAEQQKNEIEQAQQKVRDILEKIEEQRQHQKQMKAQVEDQKNPSINVQNILQENTKTLEEFEKEREEEYAQIKAEAKEQVEKEMKDLVIQRVSEEAKKEQEKTAALLEALKKEMQAKIEEAGKYKEQFVFEDLKPSVMFKNVLEFREKRNKNIRIIFDNYARLYSDVSSVQFIDPKQKKKKNESLSNLAHNLNIPKSKKSLTVINLEMFLLFCSEFKLFNEQVDDSSLKQIYSQSLNNRLTSEISASPATYQSGEMLFQDFLGSLEKISLIFFYNNHLLITSFDKIEALYQYMQLDDVLAFKKKMKIKSSTLIQKILSDDQTTQSGRDNSPSLPELHVLDYDQSIKPGDKGNLLGNLQPPPQRQQALYQPNLFAHKKPIDWGEGSSQIPIFGSDRNQFGQENSMKSSLNNPASFFKNESNFLSSDYVQVKNSNPQSYFPNNLSQPSLQQQPQRISESLGLSSSFLGENTYLGGALGQAQKNQQYLPQRNISESNLKINSLQADFQKRNYQNGNSIISRAKEIENTEIQREKQLLAFIQNKQSNRYNNAPPQAQKK